MSTTEVIAKEIARSSAKKPRKWAIGPVLFLVSVALGCSVYANLSFAVTDTAHYCWFPPFEPHASYNMNDHLGGENFNIARSLRAGEGFADPFDEKTGPTAWMPPVLPVVLAALLWALHDDRDAVMVVIIGVQLAVLIGTGILVLALARRTTERIWAMASAGLFVIGFVVDFFLWFQFTHDSWLVLATLDLIVVGVCWQRPLRTWQRAAGWGLFGGFCALVNPVVGATWGVVTLLLAVRKRAWRPLAIAGFLAVLAVSPWLVRNYLVFGAWIPVKSNLAYELCQSHCLEPSGVVHLATFADHPFSGPGRERNAYKELGEVAYMEEKGKMFREALAADPHNFVQRMLNRLQAAMFWYEPFWPEEAIRLPPWVLIRRVVHLLPLLSLLLLFATSWRRPLHAVHWLVITLYAVYLAPFVAVSYYDRYALPLLAAKVLLIIWGTDRGLCWLSEKVGSRTANQSGRPAPAVQAVPAQ